MRLTVALIALAAGVSVRLGAQCAPATQRLVTDRKFDEARAQVQALLKQNGSDDAAMDCMGRILLDNDKSGEAVDWLEKAVKANDRSAQHHLWLGNALGTEAQKASKFRQPFLARRVKAEFERAVALDPNLVDARNGLVSFYSMAPGVMGGDMNKAKEQAAEIGKLNPMRGHFAMANIYAREKNDEGVERELVAALAVAPESTTTYLSLANVYANHKRWSDAEAVLQRLLKAKPDDMSGHFYLGRLSALSGQNLERGERELKYWLANMPKDAATVTQAGAHFRLGQIHEAQGKKEAARGDYQAALAITPKNEDYKKALTALK
jgi:tetratricopeptide (TPR) repeat protein